MKIKIYGSKGTMPLFRRDSLRYGGNTSCVRLETAGHTVVLDCGSGLAQFRAELPKLANFAENGGRLKFDILLSHLHIDHIIGLSTFDPVWNPENDIRIFTKSRNNQPLAEQIFGVFRPPYWPIDLVLQNRAELIEIDDQEEFNLTGGIKVTPFSSEHHNGTTAFRIDADKSLVYLLDYEADTETEKFNELVRYCKNADLIIFDCAYLPEDYPARRGWGHSTYEAGVALAEMSGCAQMALSHFCQDYSDETLDSIARRVGKEKYILAFDGMELEV